MECSSRSGNGDNGRSDILTSARGGTESPVGEAGDRWEQRLSLHYSGKEDLVGGLRCGENEGVRVGKTGRLFISESIFLL